MPHKLMNITQKLLWSDFTYLSGQTNFIINHFRELAQKFTNNFKLKKNDLVVDIGSNDEFLNFFKKKDESSRYRSCKKSCKNS